MDTSRFASIRAHGNKANTIYIMYETHDFECALCVELRVSSSESVPFLVREMGLMGGERSG